MCDWSRVYIGLLRPFSFYLHKVSKAVDVTLPPIQGEGFAAAIDQGWRAHLGQAGLVPSQEQFLNEALDYSCVLTRYNQDPAHCHWRRLPTKASRSWL